MENYTLIELLQKEIRRTGCDARAETLFALALDQGLSDEDFMVSCDQLFYREYSKDVVYTEIKEDARKASLLQVHLSRSGIYDQLPEGLFFQPREQAYRETTAAAMAADHKTNKKKEEGIRRFFQPLENDFFWQKVQIEKEESRLLEGLQSGMLNDYFSTFWGIPSNIPRECVVPLLILLPHAYKIAGNLFLTGQCLQQLLQEEVQVRKVRAKSTDTAAGQLTGLGDSQLGVDMVCGSQFQEDYPVIEWTIGPLAGSRVHDYLAGGRRHSLLETFTRFFIPAGVYTELRILLPDERQHMVLRAGQEPILGYSSVLG